MLLPRSALVVQPKNHGRWLQAPNDDIVQHQERHLNEAAAPLLGVDHTLPEAAIAGSHAPCRSRMTSSWPGTRRRSKRLSRAA